MDSRKDEKEKHQAEIKFKTGERRTKRKDGKGCGQGLSEAFLTPNSAKPLGASAQTPWSISEAPWAKSESPWNFATDRAIRQRKRIANSTLDASASDPHIYPRSYPAE